MAWVYNTNTTGWYHNCWVWKFSIPTTPGDTATSWTPPFSAGIPGDIHLGIEIDAYTTDPGNVVAPGFSGSGIEVGYVWSDDTGPGPEGGSSVGFTTTSTLWLVAFVYSADGSDISADDPTGRWDPTANYGDLHIPHIPSNDDFANAITISGGSGSITGSTEAATLETGEPHYASIGDHSVWYRWVAPTSDTYTFAASGGQYVEVEHGSSLTTLTLDADTVSPHDGHFTAVAGRTYYIRVTEHLTAGPFTLTWTGPRPVLTGAVPQSSSWNGPAGSIGGQRTDGGPSGQAVKLFGSRLSTVVRVSFGSTDVPFTIISDTEIDVVVPVTTVESDTVFAYDATGAFGSTGFIVFFRGPVLTFAARTVETLANSVGSNNPSVAFSEDLVDFDAAQGNFGAPFSGSPRDTALAVGARYGTDPNNSFDVTPRVWYGYSQVSVEHGWSRADLVDQAVLDAMAAADPHIVDSELDTLNEADAVTAVSARTHVVAGSVGADLESLSSTSIKEAFPVGGFWIVRESEGRPDLGPDLADEEASGALIVERAFSAGTGDLPITGLSVTDFAHDVTSNEWRASGHLYSSRNLDPGEIINAPDLHPNAGDPQRFVWWDINEYTTITFTPLRVRLLYIRPMGDGWRVGSVAMN